MLSQGSPHTMHWGAGVEAVLTRAIAALNSVTLRVGARCSQMCQERVLLPRGLRSVRAEVTAVCP